MPDQAVEAAANRAIRAQMGLATGAPAPQQATPTPQESAGKPQAPAAQPQPQQQAQPQVTSEQLTAIQEQVSALKSALDQSNHQTTQQQNHIANLEGELSVLRDREAQAALKLPSDEELDELPRAEAIRRCAEVIAEQKSRALDQKYLGAFSKLAQDVVVMKNSTEEQQVRELFPGVDIEKYRPVLEQKRAQYPQASTVDLVRLVADPKELAQQPDTTQGTQDVVHMETGQGAGASGVRQDQQTRDQITEEQLQQGLVNARAAGNRMQAEAYLLELIKRRPDVPASQGRGPTGG